MVDKQKNMKIERIVSFLPSATELIYELDAQSMLYGVTHECTYPEDAKKKQKIISTPIDSENLSSKEIDAKTCQLLEDGKNLFVVNEKNLLNANPDLVIFQNICEVCAAHNDQIDTVLQILPKRPILYSMDPHNINEILESIRDVGKLLSRENKADKMLEILNERINHVKKYAENKNQKILAIEWIEPFFTAGHWIPEIIELAGGINLISKKGEKSRRLRIEEIVESNPDIIILMPCGFNVERTVIEYQKTLKEDETWNKIRAVKNKNVFAVDANSYFSKPSIRTITGLEIIAKIIQPDRFLSLNAPENSYFQIK